MDTENIEIKFLGGAKVTLKECIDFIPIMKSGGMVKLRGSHETYSIPCSADAFLCNITKLFPECLEIYLKEGLIPEKFKSGNTPVMEVAQGGNYKCLHLLLEYGFEVNTLNNKGNNALHICCREVYNGIKLLQTIILLLRYGVEIDVLDEQGYTPLSWIIMRDSKDYKISMVEEILNKASEKGEEYLYNYVNMEQSGGKDTTLLSFALSLEKPNFDLIILLLKYGADINHHCIEKAIIPQWKKDFDDYLEVKNSLSYKKNIKGIPQMK